MATTIDIRDLPARLDEALALADSGTEMVLTDGPTPRAKIISCQGSRPRVAGLHAGAIHPAPDFDALLPDDFWTGRP